MTAPITLDMLGSASSAEFPVIDLGRTCAANPGRWRTSPGSFAMRSKTSGF